MELRHMRYYTAIVEAKGFRKASRRLHIAQPALSKTVSDLEDELGLKLLERQGAQVQPTSAGMAFYKKAKRTLEQADEAVVAAKRAEKGQTGSLKIGFIPFATHHFMPELIHKYKQQNPGIEISLMELTPAKQLEAFSRGELDVGFTRQSVGIDSEFTSRLLFHVPLLVVLPISRLVTDGKIHIKDLASDHFILLDRSEAPALSDSIVSLCRGAGFTPQIDSRGNLVEAIFLLVKAEEGVSILPAWARSVTTNGLQYVRLEPENVQAELVLLWKPAGPTPALVSFTALVEAELKHIQEKTITELVA